MKSPTRWPFLLCCFVLTPPLLATASAQPPVDEVFFEVAAPPPLAEGGIAFADHHLKILSFEEGFETKLVKGAPYQAEAVTEIVQTLADGNRIVRKTTARVARDGEGRTRRETSVAAIGLLAPAGASPRTVFISDPVAGTRYVLELDERTARKLPAEPRFAHAEAKTGASHDRIMFLRGHHGPGGKLLRKKLSPEKSESLGSQAIEGVDAEGTRTRVEIPAGEIGNERPIEIVTERWYSPELQAVVMSRHSDPQVGETTYRLLNISRGEPDPALFQVPADFKITEASEKPFHKRLLRPKDHPREP